MKIGRLFLFVGMFVASMAILAGCHGQQQQVPVTKQNFGYPGMKLDASYYAAMAKVRAYQASHPAGGPPKTQTPPQSNNH